jgi:hypothetical protein
MKLSQHPEYESLYRRHSDLNDRCRQAVAAWRVGGHAISVAEYDLVWSVENARQFAHDLSRMFQAYNRILWEQFSYCGECGGQCCVLDASDIRPFDFIATALLDLTMPVLPGTISVTSRECVYLAGGHCNWSADWRTIKCWSFYCLGDSHWARSDSAGDLYQAVTAGLRQVVHQYLPKPLQHYETNHGLILGDYLDDPVAFADITHQALQAVFVSPFHDQFPLFDLARQQAGRTQTTEILLVDTELLTFIAATTEFIYDYSPTASIATQANCDRLLADLESLEWIMAGQPQNKAQLLAVIHQHYLVAAIPKQAALTEIWTQMHRITAPLSVIV